MICVNMVEKWCVLVRLLFCEVVVVCCIYCRLVLVLKCLLVLVSMMV